MAGTVERQWTPEVVVRLRAAYAMGGRSGVVGAFPDKSPAALRSALRRFVLDAPAPGPAIAPPSPEAVRAALRAMPATQLVAGIASLLRRDRVFRQRGVRRMRSAVAALRPDLAHLGDAA